MSRMHYKYIRVYTFWPDDIKFKGFNGGHMFAILCLWIVAANTKQRGVIDEDWDALASFCRVSLADFKDIIARMQKKGLINLLDGGVIELIDYEKWQPKSQYDTTSKNRQAKRRAKIKEESLQEQPKKGGVTRDVTRDVSVTSRNVTPDVTPIDKIRLDKIREKKETSLRSVSKENGSEKAIPVGVQKDTIPVFATESGVESTNAIEVVSEVIEPEIIDPRALQDEAVPKTSAAEQLKRWKLAAQIFESGPSMGMPLNPELNRQVIIEIATMIWNKKGAPENDDFKRLCLSEADKFLNHWHSAGWKRGNTTVKSAAGTLATWIGNWNPRTSYTNKQEKTLNQGMKW